jgi:ketosteroid isomerase-like protein
VTERNSTASRLEGLFAAIDAKDTEAFLGFLTDDAVFRFGSAPEAIGQNAIRDGVNGFFTTIAGSTHAIGNVIESGSTLVCEAEVTYQRHDGSELTLPFTNVFELSGELISHYKIYIDIAPLYAG